MALIVYPLDDYDSFVDITTATTYINSYTTFSSNWAAIDDATKEVYLRIATDRIIDKIDTLLLTGSNECILKSCSIMAVHDLVFEISSSVNPNTGLVTKEKVGDLEVNYTHGNVQRQLKNRNTNPFPTNVQTCLTGYGATFVSGIQVTIGRS